MAIGHGSTVNTGAGVEGLALGAYARAGSAGWSGAMAVGGHSDAVLDGTALGYYAKAEAQSSVALGRSSTATERDTVSVGSSTIKRRLVNLQDARVSAGSTDAVTGNQLFATNEEIKKIKTSSDGAMARLNAAKVMIGQNAAAEGNYDTAVGYGAKATGSHSNAIGYSATTAGANAVAIGTLAAGAAASAVSLGNRAAVDATSDSGVAVGANAKVNANAAGSVALGANAVATVANTVSVGTATARRKIVNVADGTVGSGSNEAVTGNQLFSTEQRVTTATTTANTAKTTAESAQTAANSALGRLNASTQVMGQDAAASGSNAVAVGRRSRSEGTSSVAIGNESVASGIYGTAIGHQAKASGTWASSMGQFADAAGNSAIAAGTSTKAAGNHSVAIGALAEVDATGQNSVALGHGAKVAAGAKNAIALGYGSVAATADTVSVGSATVQRKIVNVADGEVSGTSNDAITGKQLSATEQRVSDVTATANAAKTTAETAATTATAALGRLNADKIVVGQGAAATGSNATAVGMNSKASGNFATASGHAANATGAYGVAVGSGSSASQASGIALGNSAAATAANAIATGRLSKSQGTSAVAMGNESTASGNYTTAIGHQAKAGSAWTNAMGYQADAAGSSAIAVGSVAKASANHSIAIGDRAEVNANAIDSVAVGRSASVSAAATGAVALGMGSVATAANTVSVGSATVKRKIVNVADGTVSATSTDAVTGKQLHLQQQAVADNADRIDGNQTGIGSNRDSIADNRSGIGANRSDIAALRSEFDAYVPDLDGLVTFNEDRTIVDLEGARLTGVRDGDISSATSKDAVTGGQLFVTNERVASLEGLNQYVKVGTDGESESAHAVLMGVAIGDSANAATTAATAIGAYAAAHGVSSVALGRGSYVDALGVDGFALGTATRVSAHSGLAIGAQSVVEAGATNSVALGNLSIVTESNAVSLGNDNLKRRVVNMGAGINTNDAVNIAQLGQTLDGLGGGARVGAAGQIIAPQYKVQGSDYTNVGDALGALDSAVVTARSGVDSIDNRLNRLFQEEATARTDGPGRLNLGGAQGMVLGNVANGMIAAGSRDAVNGGQLYEVQKNLQGQIDGLEGRTAEPAAFASRQGAPMAMSVEGGGEAIVSQDTPAPTPTPVANDPVAPEAVVKAEGEHAVAVGSEGKERSVKHVARGTADTDAVNVQQLNDVLERSNQYTDVAVEGLNKRLDGMDKRFNRMAAMSSAQSAMAMNTAGLNTYNRLGAGVGHSDGESALAVGYQRVMNERGSATFSLNGAFTNSGEKTVGVGVGIGW